MGFASEGKEPKTPLADGTEIVMPVCEVCQRIGTTSCAGKTTKFWCTSGKGHPHKKVSMRPYVFKSTGPEPEE